jgi:hypothetical protein
MLLSAIVTITISPSFFSPGRTDCVLAVCFTDLAVADLRTYRLPSVDWEWLSGYLGRFSADSVIRVRHSS